jgi:hypothetical protein
MNQVLDTEVGIGIFRPPSELPGTRSQKKGLTATGLGV